MKIAISGMSSNVGGVETYIINLYHTLKKLNHEVYFLVYEENICYASQIKDYDKVVLYISPRRKNYIKHIIDLRRVFSEYKFDVMWSNVCSLSCIDELKIAKKYGVSHRFLHSHNSQNMGGIVTKFLHNIHKINIQNYVTKVFACSHVAATWMFPPELSKEAIILNNSIDSKKFRYNEEIQKEMKKELNVEGRIVIGHVGRFHFQKNHSFLLKIVNEMIKINNQITLVLCGSGELEDAIKDEIEELNLGRNVILLGNRDDMERVYQTFDLFIFPSLFEGLPFVLIEAQAAGIPCLISDTISKEVAITGLVEFNSLQEDAKIWAYKALKLYKTHKVDTYLEICQRGYDIGENTKVISKLWES